MRKSFLLVAAALALGLVACGETQPTEKGNVEVPVAEGKVTFHFQLGEGSIEFKEYESIWLVGGGINGWKTGYDAYEMKNLEGTKTYYAQVEGLDVSASQGYDYSLVIGYNTAANMPAGSSGLQWVDGRKSDECEAAKGADGLQNLLFTYEEGQTTVDLGTHTFTKSLPAPTAPLKNYTFEVNFKEAVPEYGKVLIFGSYPGCGWTTPGGDKTDDENIAIINGAEMTASNGRKTFRKTFESMVAGDYECKILVEYTTATTSISWNAVDQTKDNYHFSITVADGDNYTLDILGEEATFALADPNATLAVSIEVINIGGALTAAGMGIGGDFNGWTINGNMCEKVTDDKFVYNAGSLTGGDHEFCVMALDSWADKVCNADDSNLKVSLDASKDSCRVVVSCDFAKLGVEKQTAASVEVLY